MWRMAACGIDPVRGILFGIGLLMAVWPGSVWSQDPSGEVWKVGLAREVITPQTGVWLAGYGSKRAPEGKLHDLWMKAISLEDRSGNRAVLITSDFQGVPRSMSDRVFAAVKEKYGLRRDQIMITFSHNHCGPRLGDDLRDYYPEDPEQEQLVQDYTDLMVGKMTSLVGKSLENPFQARLWSGMGHATFAVNRRNNREPDVPTLLEKGKPLQGPVDHSVPVLSIQREDGSLAAVLFGYACHPTTLSFMKWCGDYPGFAQLKIEQAHPGAMAMFVNTCGGDQNPLPRRTVELCEKYGTMLAEGVEEGLAAPKPFVQSRLKTAFSYVDLPYLQVSRRADLEAAGEGKNAIMARWARRMLKKLDAGEEFPAAYPYPVHAWQLGGQVLLIGQGAETVVDYALRFKSEYGAGTWVLGYTDDMIAYIPSRRVWEEGGYEGGSSLYEYGRPALRWEGSIEDRIAATVDRLVREVRSVK